MKTFFRIRRIFIRSQRELNKLSEGRAIRLDEHPVGAGYSTYEKAEVALKYFCENFMDEYSERRPRTAGFQIIESVMDGREDLPYDCDIHYWSFDRYGQPLANGRCCSEYDESPFRGRPANERPFEKGEIVLDCSYGYLQVGIITGTPWTPEEIEVREAEIGDTLRRLDPSDDSYRVDYCNNVCHSHRNVTHVFPLPFPIVKLKIHDKLLAVVKL